MLEALTSVPLVASAAVITAALLIRDMLEGEKAHGTGRTPPGASSSPYAADQGAGQARHRLYALVCVAVLGGLVLLRFVTLAS